MVTFKSPIQQNREIPLKIQANNIKLTSKPTSTNKNSKYWVVHAIDENETGKLDADILYMTRVQKERFSDLMEYERVKNVYILNNDMLRQAKPNMRILHPLPRVNEIAYDVDENPHAYYIQQAGNGLFAREAIFCDVLGISLDEIRNDKTIIL